MPAFQRQYVWNMEQIEKLWDSILLDYPISVFLFWHIDENNTSKDTYFCQFLNSATFNFQKKSSTPNYETAPVNTKITDTAVLDGQQRLTSFYLSLFSDDVYIKGKHEKGSGGSIAKLRIELDKNKIEDTEGEYNTKQYSIVYTEKTRNSPTQFEFRNLIKDNRFKNKKTRQEAIDDSIKSVPNSSRNYANDLLNNLCRKIFDEKLISYIEMYNINQEDALEMFVRFNSGGKPLKKSDITMSILEVFWQNVRPEFGRLLANSSYKNFGNDFLIRTALMLYGDVIKSNINKKTADDLHKNWREFSTALKNLERLLKTMNIEVNHFSTSWNILLPIIYFIYNNPDYDNDREAIKAYLIRGALFTYFKTGTTGKLSQMRNKISANDFRITMEMLDNMSELRITEARIDDLLNLEYGSKVVVEALYYLSLGWQNSKCSYAVDHLHPLKVFATKPFGIDMTQWKKSREKKNKLPNLQRLEGKLNISKGDMSLVNFFNCMNEEQQEIFRKQSLIPDNVSLELEDFEDFYEKRKELLKEKLTALLDGNLEANEEIEFSDEEPIIEVDDNEEQDLFEIDKEDIDKKVVLKRLRAVGFDTFVKYYRKFADPNLETGDIKEILEQNESYKESSCNTKASNGKRIIENGWGKAALAIIANANRIDDSIIEDAKKLLKKIK